MRGQTIDLAKSHPDTLFVTDNSAILCGAHLGASARFTGHDISGQEVIEVDEWYSQLFRDAGMVPRCETCAKGGE